uniref:Uncharacterized protein n=1 Tax=Anguilla anguilla TaxID=7936 RepID=A0A0E9V7T9_ANGAN
MHFAWESLNQLDCLLSHEKPNGCLAVLLQSTI